MGSIIVVANSKGGCSKSTTALNIAYMFHHAGLRVLAVDADKGGSLRGAFETRQWRGKRDAERKPHEPKYRGDLAYIENVRHTGSDVDAMLLSRAPDYDAIVVDSGGEGQVSEETRLALMVANLAIVPCRPCPADWKRLSAVHDVVKDITIRLNPSLKSVLYATQASNQRNASDVTDLYREAEAFPFLPVMTAVMQARECYKRWPDDGEALHEKRATRDTRPAHAELDKLFTEIRTHV